MSARACTCRRRGDPIAGQTAQMMPRVRGSGRTRVPPLPDARQRPRGHRDESLGRHESVGENYETLATSHHMSTLIR